MDGFESNIASWRACEKRGECPDAGWKVATGGRESVTIIYKALHEYPKWRHEPIPIFGNMHGLLLDPKGMHFFCGYPGDGDSQDFGRRLTNNKNCDPPGGNAHCKPGCTHDRGWCDPENPFTGRSCLCGKDFCDNLPPQPWHPTDFAKMLEMYNKHGGPSNWAPMKYNEFILSSKYWNDHLPDTIQAIYYHCNGNKARGKDEAVKMRHAFLKEYALEHDDSRVPLLCIDKNNWEYPFRLG